MRTGLSGVRTSKQIYQARLNTVMDITDGETPGGDGLPGPASRNLQGQQRKARGSGRGALGGPRLANVPPDLQLAAVQQFLQVLFKSVTTAIMLFLAGNLTAVEILHYFNHNFGGGHKSPPITNTTRREDRGDARVKIQQVEGENGGSATGNDPTSDRTELVPCEAVGVGCNNRVPSGFCLLRQHLCMVAPHPDRQPAGELLAEILPELRTQRDFLDRLLCGQEKILVQLPLLTAGGSATGNRLGHQAIEPVTENEARRLFALLRALELESNFRKAPVTRVFMLYCLDGKSRDAVARDCNCSPPASNPAGSTSPKNSTASSWGCSTTRKTCAACRSALSTSRGTTRGLRNFQTSSPPPSRL